MMTTADGSKQPVVDFPDGDNGHLKKVIGLTAAGLAAVAAVVILIVYVAIPYWPDKPTPTPAQTLAAICPITCVTDGSFVFNPAMATVEHDIAAEDHTVTTNLHRPYVTVVYMDPLTSTRDPNVSLGRMVDGLRGAYLALMAANAKPGPGIQLLIANMGDSNSESQEATVVRYVESLEVLKPSEHIVAVVGLGISLQNSENAAATLATNQIAMFAALTTADEFNYNDYAGLDQIVPDDNEQVTALHGFLTATSHAFLFMDQQATDIYTHDLVRDIRGVFTGTRFYEYHYTPNVSVTNEQFQAFVENTCVQPGQASPLVFYAGRASILQSLIQKFQQEPVCHRKKVTLLTGDDADDLPLTATVTPPNAKGAQVSVEYADIANLDDTTGAFTEAYGAAFGTPDPGDPGAHGPWTIANYNAIMAAAKAIDVAYQDNGSQQIPTKAEVVGLTQGDLLNLNAPSSALEPGTFGINGNGQLADPAVPVYLDTDGSQCTVQHPGVPAC
jgi:hypothetical protein